MNQEAREVCIFIECVANGYVVKSGAVGPEGRRVFESFDALVDYLRARLPIYPVYMGTMTVTVSTPTDNLTIRDAPKKRKR